MQNPQAPLPFQRLQSIADLAGSATASVIARSLSLCCAKTIAATGLPSAARSGTHLSQAAFEQELSSRDLRIVLSIELRNPDRGTPAVSFSTISTRSSLYPPTNHLIVREKVRRGQGRAPLPPPPARTTVLSRLSSHAPRHRQIGRVRRATASGRRSRPHFQHAGWLFVLARQGLSAASLSTPQVSLREIWAQRPAPPIRRGTCGGLSRRAADGDGPAERLLPQGDALRTLWRERAGLPEHWLRGVSPACVTSHHPAGSMSA